MKFSPPFIVVASKAIVDHATGRLRDVRETLLPGQYRTRSEAERVASEASRRDQFSTQYAVKACRDGGAEFYWVTIYKNGWLKDAQMRGSYTPSDQRASNASHERVPRRFAQGTRANDSPVKGSTMIRKSNAGYTVFARSGRKMGTYRTMDEAQVRLGQLEAFKENRAPLGQMSPTVRRKSGGYYVRAKSGRSMGWYPTKAAALRRKGQLEAQGAKFFKETRGFTKKSGSPGRKPEEGDYVLVYGDRGHGKGFAISQPYRLEDMAVEEARALSRPGSYGGEVRVARLTGGRMLEVGRAKNGVFHETSEHSWPGQPRRHAHAAKLGHRRAARSPLPRGQSTYTIKIGGGRHAGEYDGKPTLAATVARAKAEFLPHLGTYETLRVVHFDRDGERVHTDVVIKD